jgi:hypothetical protein
MATVLYDANNVPTANKAYLVDVAGNPLLSLVDSTGVRRAPRVHITLPEDWNRATGTDYWAHFGPETLAAAAGSSALLSDSGWTLTALGVETAGSGGDFLSSSDPGVPPHVLTDLTGDILQSPAVFGTYSHMLGAADILGYTPTKLAFEWYGAMTVHTANEPRSAWGLVQAGGAIGTDANRLAVVSTDGTNFTAFSSGDSDAGALDDAAWHRFKVVLDSSVAAGTNMVEWFIDGTSQGTLDLLTDVFPCSFGMAALTVNRPALAWVHGWYY